ncbi:MAG: M3 family oligoendopeptidase [Candidatus Bathyarchaeota archaeon]|nr:MAG: M3 family oligoendopeptidase [Candidatus Bathyarchaeota archaeon]
MTKEEMIWDLSQLVENTNPVKIQEQLQIMIKEANKFRETYRGKISDLEVESLLKMLETNDKFILKFEGAVMYCFLRYYANSIDDVAKQLNEAARKAFTQVGQAKAFVDIELGKLLSEKPSLMNEPALAEYKHYLERVLRKVPHMLSEIEEQLIILKDKNGINAWEMLQSDWLSTRMFKIKIKGELKTLPYGKMVGLYQSPDRNLRKNAYQIVYEGLGNDEIIWASAVRAVCEDHIQMCRLRKYSDPMEQSLLANDVNKQAIVSLMKVIEKNASVYQKYLRMKAKLMNLPKLANYDLAAPLPEAPEKLYSWNKARKEIVTAYMGFDKEIGNWIEEMFAKRHIDAEIRKGKASGAFCSSWLAGKSAYILQSFNGRMGDLFTQAHELGHAIHAYYYSREQKPSNCEIGSCIAETGSIFGELLLAESLLSKTETKEEKQAILAHILDEFGMAAFQVSARFFLEKQLYSSIEEGKFLDGETVAKLWVTARDSICGDAIDWLDVLKWEWTKSPHYFIANYRFYNYPYVYAQLFVYALYKLYKEQGKGFVPKLKRILAVGSSKAPIELSAELGFDITSEEFWEKGIKQAEEFINALEETL